MATVYLFFIIFMVSINTQRVTFFSSSLTNNTNGWTDYGISGSIVNDSKCPAASSCYAMSESEECYRYIDTRGYIDIYIAYDIRTSGVDTDESCQFWYTVGTAKPSEFQKWTVGAVHTANDNPISVSHTSFASDLDDTSSIGISFWADMSSAKYCYLNNVIVTGVSTYSTTTAAATTHKPTNNPIITPTSKDPSVAPTISPTSKTDEPTKDPSVAPTISPTSNTDEPTYTNNPSFSPTNIPSLSPMKHPSISPTATPVFDVISSTKITKSKTLYTTKIFGENGESEKHKTRSTDNITRILLGIIFAAIAIIIVVLIFIALYIFHDKKDKQHENKEAEEHEIDETQIERVDSVSIQRMDKQRANVLVPENKISASSMRFTKRGLINDVVAKEEELYGSPQKESGIMNTTARNTTGYNIPDINAQSVQDEGQTDSDSDYESMYDNQQNKPGFETTTGETKSDDTR